jgi:hypothetical protein
MSSQQSRRPLSPSHCYVSFYSNREKKAKSHFDDIRRKVMDIYQSWSVPSEDEVRHTANSSILCLIFFVDMRSG